MTIGEKLSTSKNALDGALRLANATTEAEDSNICDAINTLIDGYGQGGAKGGSFIPSSNQTSVSIDIGADTFNCIYIQANPLPTVEAKSHYMFVRGVMISDYKYIKWDGSEDIRKTGQGVGFPEYNNGVVSLTGSNFTYTQEGNVVTITVNPAYPFKQGVEYIWIVI